MKTIESRVRVGVRAATLACCLLAVGCDDPLKRVDLVTTARVLGARVEVEGEPERASPAPGETARIRWLVAERDPEPLLGWAFAICAAGAPGSSLPTCAEPPFAMASADVPVVGEPTIDFTVPGDIESRALAVFGVVCPDSEPTVDDEAFGCAGAGGTLVSLDFELEVLGQTNRNPTLEPDALGFDGASLPAGFDCATLPSVRPGSSHTFELALDESDRDAVEQPTSADPAKEELQISHFTTAGTLERAFTVIEASDASLSVTVPWEAPNARPADGLVRFFFVVRDLRGGADFVERSVCMGP